MRPIHKALLALTAIVLAGCGTSTTVRHHALTSNIPSQASGNARLLVELLPVALPERLNRDEMVLTNNLGQLEVHETDHWAAPLQDEIRQILSDALWDRLGAADVYQAPVAPSATGLAQFRLALRIERFEAMAGRSAIVEGSWTARLLPQGKSATCRASIAVPLTDGSPKSAATALSEGTRQLSRQLADSIGRISQDGVTACPSE